MVDHILSTVKTFDPVAFIGRDWKVIKDESDKRTEAMTEVDFTRVNFETCLKDGETYITGEEKLKRLKEGGNILLGAETFLALWEEKDHATLEWLYKEKGVTYLDFFGTILGRPDGRRCVLYLYRDDGGWHWRCFWLGLGWRDRDFSVSLASK